MPKANLVLIGFMGTGKTRIGKICARELGFAFRDSDTLIERKIGRRVSDIFRERGETAFRAIEREMIAELAQGTEQVISTGGGVALSDANVEVLRETGTVLWLSASPEVLLSRVGGKNAYKRPLLASAPDPLQKIREMLIEREPYYRDAADFNVLSENRRPGDIAEQIIRRFLES